MKELHVYTADQILQQDISKGCVADMEEKRKAYEGSFFVGGET
jgi:hypothetical protein